MLMPESNRRYEYELITKEERVARDPRGLTPVTIIGDSVFVRKVSEQSKPAAQDSSINLGEGPSIGDPFGLAEGLLDLAKDAKNGPRELGEEK